MLLDSRRRQKKHQDHGGSWAVSYVDMLTLLLCFFIIFFGADRLAEENRSKRKLLVDVTGQLGTASGPVGATDGSGPTDQMDQGRSAASAEASPGDETGQSMLLERLETELDDQKMADLSFREGVLEIGFKGVSFFDSGKTGIRLDAREKLMPLVRVLSQYKDQIRVTVQGHTDGIPVANGGRTFSDNWELSVLRATSVLKLLLNHGFPQEILSAEGFADTRRTPASGTRHAEERKVTLKIEERKKSSNRSVKESEGRTAHPEGQEIRQ